MKLTELKNKKILIVGRGVEGQAVFEYLKKNLPDQIIDLVDKKDGDNYLFSQKDYDLAVKSPGIKSELIEIPYTTATNIFFANAKGKIVGVTGTKGKSTTSTLIYEILKQNGKDAYLGGNIGVSPLEFIDLLTDMSITVLELSSFQLSDIKFSPHIAVMLMIAPEHLDYHVDIERYIEAKRNILRFQKENDFAIINSDYPPSRESDLLTDGKVYWIGVENQLEQGCFVKDGGIYIRLSGGEKRVMEVQDIKIQGKHNLENACAAILASMLAGADLKSTKLVLKNFKGLSYRLEYISTKKNVKYYNDSLATIPEATIGALEALGEDVQTLIAGGHDRGIDYSELGKYIATTNIKTLILFPETGKKIWDAVVKETPESNRPKKFEVSSMKDAIKLASENTDPERICLLSPASSSFGIFKDYKDRGDQFREEVESLTN